MLRYESACNQLFGIDGCQFKRAGCAGGGFGLPLRRLRKKSKSPVSICGKHQAWFFLAAARRAELVYAYCRNNSAPRAAAKKGARTIESTDGQTQHKQSPHPDFFASDQGR